MFSARFEGYGPGDSAVLVDCLTDDRERTAAAVRSAFLGHGGRPGAAGSVAYLFKEVGRLVYPARSDAAALVGLAAEAGAEDVTFGRDGVVEVATDPAELEAVHSQLQRAGFADIVREVTWRAAAAVRLEGADAERMRDLLAALERLDDVQSIYTNAEVAGEVLASI